MKNLNTDDALLSQNDERYALVPDDFPRQIYSGAVSGAQPKYIMVKYSGKYYIPGNTPPELYERWDICEDLAKQFSKKSLESKAGKRAHMSEEEILQQYFDRLLEAGWVSDVEGQWVIGRVAALIDWPVPQGFKPKS